MNTFLSSIRQVCSLFRSTEFVIFRACCVRCRRPMLSPSTQYGANFREFAEWIKSTTKSAYKWFKLSFHIQSFLQMSLVSAYYSINLLFYVPKCRMPIANANEQKCRKYIYCMCWRMQSCLVNINVNQKAFGFHLVSIEMKCRPVVACIRVLRPSSTFSNRFFFQYPGEPSLRSIWIND